MVSWILRFFFAKCTWSRLEPLQYISFLRAGVRTHKDCGSYGQERRLQKLDILREADGADKARMSLMYHGPWTIQGRNAPVPFRPFVKKLSQYIWFMCSVTLYQLESELKHVETHLPEPTRTIHAPYSKTSRRLEDAMIWYRQISLCVIRRKASAPPAEGSLSSWEPLLLYCLRNR